MYFHINEPDTYYSLICWNVVLNFKEQHMLAIWYCDQYDGVNHPTHLVCKKNIKINSFQTTEDISKHLQTPATHDK